MILLDAGCLLTPDTDGFVYNGDAENSFNNSLGFSPGSETTDAKAMEFKISSREQTSVNPIQF